MDDFRIATPRLARPRLAAPRPTWWRRGWLLCWSALGRLAALRRSRIADIHVRRADYRSQTRMMGVRMSASLRDRLRGTWLRIAREEEPAHQADAPIGTARTDHTRGGTSATARSSFHH